MSNRGQRSRTELRAKSEEQCVGMSDGLPIIALAPPSLK